MTAKMRTRCPACGTAFRITQTQLDARNGQVRCGHCQVVFDGEMHLSQEIETIAPDPSAAPAEEPQDKTVILPRKSAALEAPNIAAEASPKPAAEPPAKTKPAEKKKRSEPPLQLPNPPTLMAIENEDGSYSFDSPAAPARRQVGIVSVLAVLLLVLTLAGQGAYLFRGELAQQLPGMRPLLEAGCEALGCQVPLPREASLVAIESSELQFAPGTRDVLILSGSLRNRASYAQAFPAIELTLTDSAETTAARRVLHPRDYLATHPPGAFAPQSEVPFKLHIDAAGLGATGYRLYVFYL